MAKIEERMHGELPVFKAEQNLREKGVLLDAKPENCREAEGWRPGCDGGPRWDASSLLGSMPRCS
jgi:hypothetical protein